MDDRDLAIEIVRNVTDGDPLAVLTMADIPALLQRAVCMGYQIPTHLTPELFLEIYEDLKPEAQTMTITLTKEYYREPAGCTASILINTDGRCLLTVRTPHGYLVRSKTYATHHGARVALGILSGGMMEFVGKGAI